MKGSLKDVIDYAENPDKTTDPKYLDDDLRRVLSYVSNDAKTDRRMYVSTINCPKYDPYGAMMATKRRFGKLGGNVHTMDFRASSRERSRRRRLTLLEWKPRSECGVMNTKS